MATVWEDLQLNGLGIYRDTDGFTYGHDAVLLSSFAKFRKNDTVLDLGSGTGILSVLIHAKTGASVDAVDILEDACALAMKSVAKNGLSGMIHIHCSDIRQLPCLGMIRCAYDGVICNPPYYSGGTESPDPSRAMSRHQIDAGIEDFAACAARMLKNGGKAYFCYPTAGLSRYCAAFEKEGLAVKRIRFVRSKAGRMPYLFLAEAKKGGGVGVVMEEDIILEDL